MSKLARVIVREVPLLRRYIAEVSEHWRGILGSATVVGALWFAGYFGAVLQGKVTEVLPSSAAQWLTHNRLLALSITFVLSVAQYLAWRALRVKSDGDGPDIDERLVLLEERLKPTNVGQWHPEQTPLPPYVLIVSLRTKGDLLLPRLKIKCTGPMARTATRSYNAVTKERLAVVNISKPTGSTIFFDKSVVSFGGEPLPAGSRLDVLIYSLSTTRLVSVYIDDDKH